MQLKTYTFYKKTEFSIEDLYAITAPEEGGVEVVALLPIVAGRHVAPDGGQLLLGEFVRIGATFPLGSTFKLLLSLFLSQNPRCSHACCFAQPDAVKLKVTFFEYSNSSRVAI